MLQCARLPNTPQEWAAVGEAVSSLSPYLQANSSPELLLRDLQLFVRGVEQWWAGRKREGSGALKRVGPPNGFMQPSAKRGPGSDPLLSLPPEHLLVSAANLPLDASFLPGAMPGADQGRGQLQGLPALSMSPMHAAGPQLGAAMDDEINRVISMANMAELADLGNNLAANGMAGNGGHPQTNAAAVNNNNSTNWTRKVVILNVGGKTFSTTLSTLAAVEGSYFHKLAQKALTSTAGEFFLDRSGELFNHVLDYLRCHKYGEDPGHALPEDVTSLRLLLREASFYRLAGLEQAIARALPAAAAAACDALYIQTGFVHEGDELVMAHKDMLGRLNSELGAKAQQGFVATPPQFGTESQGKLRNIWAHVLFKNLV